jgi:hypothetical protein
MIHKYLVPKQTLIKLYFSCKEEMPTIISPTQFYLFHTFRFLLFFYSKSFFLQIIVFSLEKLEEEIYAYAFYGSCYQCYRTLPACAWRSLSLTLKTTGIVEPHKNGLTKDLFYTCYGVGWATNIQTYALLD